MGLFKIIYTKISDEKHKREFERNKIPLEVALEKARREFDPNDYTSYNLDEIKQGIKKGLDVRYCLLSSKDFESKARHAIGSILEILEFEKEEGLLPGTILKNYYNGYYITGVYNVVENIKRERERQQDSTEVSGYFRKR